jgi:hypothetical protein
MALTEGIGIFIAFVVLVALLTWAIVYRDHKSKDNYCICTNSGPGGRGKVCQGNMRKAYINGLTEYSDFAAMQKAAGGPKWKMVQPGQLDYPPGRKTCENSRDHPTYM